MHTWLRGMTVAMKCSPKINPPNTDEQAIMDKELGHKLMAHTLAGPLVAELDKEWAANALHTVTENLETLETTFLGADEAAAERLELANLRQGGSHMADNVIPAYCQQFSSMATDMRPIPSLVSRPILK